MKVSWPFGTALRKVYPPGYDRKAAVHVRLLGLDDRIPEQPIDETSGVKGGFDAPFCGSPVESPGHPAGHDVTYRFSKISTVP
jgi:hypothetical protein